MSQGSGWHAAQLGYCGNVHPASDLAALRASIGQLFQGVRHRRGLPEQDSGLWISARAAQALQSPLARAAFLTLLRDSGLRLTSLNGFPHGQFHQRAVKAEVYQPDWADPRRLAYSLQLARLLADGLPEDCQHGMISTVPLGYAATWDRHKQRLAEQQLRQLTAELATLQRETGKQIVFCLEMEPDCVLETTDQAIDFFRRWQATAAHHPYLALCFDVCHQAVVFEDCYQSLERLNQAGVPVGKIQLSNALVCTLPAVDERRRAEVLRVLGDFVESTYLHQVKAQPTQAHRLAWPDLPAALAEPPQDLAQCPELRIHFHVPLFCEELLLPELRGSQDALHQTFDFLADHPGFRPVLEVETYSWNVLPPALRPRTEQALLQGIAAELQWVETQLQQRQLLLPPLRRREVRAHAR